MLIGAPVLSPPPSCRNDLESNALDKEGREKYLKSLGKLDINDTTILFYDYTPHLLLQLLLLGSALQYHHCNYSPGLTTSTKGLLSCAYKIVQPLL